MFWMGSVAGGLTLAAWLCIAGCGGPQDPALGPVLPGFAWRAAAPCPVARFEAMGAAVGDQLFVLGGFTSGDLDVTTQAHLYDVTRDAWTAVSDVPGAQTHAGLAADGSFLWMAGGFKGWRSRVTTAEAWRYDPARDTWASMPALPQPRAALALVYVGGELHAIGGLAADGQTDSSLHQVLASAGAAWKDAPALPNPRNHLGGAALGESIFIVGGRHGWDEQNGNQSSLDVFDRHHGLWSERVPIPAGRSEIAASTFSSRNRLIVVGGSINGAVPSAQVYVYDAGADRWMRLPPLAGPRKGAVAAAIGQQVVVTTGSPTGTDPDRQTWVGCCLQ